MKRTRVLNNSRHNWQSSKTVSTTKCKNNCNRDNHSLRTNVSNLPFRRERSAEKSTFILVEADANYIILTRMRNADKITWKTPYTLIDKKWSDRIALELNCSKLFKCRVNQAERIAVRLRRIFPTRLRRHRWNWSWHCRRRRCKHPTCETWCAACKAHSIKTR
jgi:hypothetical protein